MSGSEEKKLNSLHEVDSLYKVQGGKAAYQISPAYGQNTLYKVNSVHDAWERALAAESICQDILTSARNQLYLNMRFMDCALSALFFREIWAFILLERMELSCTISRKSLWNSSGEARKR